MTIYVFAGPTISAERARAELDAVYLPPVKQGDVYRLMAERPWAIGLIDGFFEQVPSVWHKEILWAMSQGVHVFGSASMGALRAAELCAFGMVGVGRIYEAYRDGRLTDDDEVALRHGPPETGYVAVSEALVNIRWTLASAAKLGVIEASTGSALERIAKGWFYPQRSYPRLIRAGCAAGLPRRELDALRDWLPEGRIDRKLSDALEMLREIRRRRESDAAPNTAAFLFEHTDMWEGVVEMTSSGAEDRSHHRWAEQARRG